MRYAAALVEGYRTLDERTILIASFGLGVAAQAALLLRNDWNWWKLGGCAALGLTGMLPGKHEPVYQPLFHVLVSFSLFSVTFALTFSKDILPILSEAILLSYTLVFWFAFYSFYYQGGPLQTVLLIVLLVPTIATLYVAFRKTRLTFLLKLILYTWFLIIIVCLGLFQFPYSHLALFFEDRQVPWITPLDSLAAGMAFLFLLANATYVFYLIPIPGRNESWEERMRQWHEFTDLMTQRFADAQVTLGQALIVLGVEGVALLLNAIYRWLSPALVINVAIILPGILSRLLPSAVPASTGATEAPAAPSAPVPHSRHLLKGKYRRGPLS